MLKSCSVSSQNLTYEIILTLGQAFEVAYQLALQAQKSRPLGASAAEMIETKSSKPVPKPRVGTRKSAVREPPGLEGVGWSGRPEGLLSHRQPAPRIGPPAPLLSPRPGRRLRPPPSPGAPGAGPQRAPSNATPCLCLLCSAPQVLPPPGSRCCHCHTCTTHRPSYLPLPSVSPGVKVFTPPAVCVSVSLK